MLCVSDVATPPPLELLYLFYFAAPCRFALRRYADAPAFADATLIVCHTLLFEIAAVSALMIFLRLF